MSVSHSFEIKVDINILILFLGKSYPQEKSSAPLCSLIEIHSLEVANIDSFSLIKGLLKLDYLADKPANPF